jgi:hypothetical protein
MRGWLSRMEIWLGKRNENDLTVRIPYDVLAIERIRQLPKRFWNPTERAWIVPYTLLCVEELLWLFNDMTLKVEPVLLAECHLLQDRLLDRESRSRQTKIVFEDSKWGHSQRVS